MENKVVNLEIKSNVDESIAGLKALKRQLKDTAAGSEEFKRIYNQIDDLEDKIKSAKNTSSDWVDSLEQAGGPLGMLGAGINRAKVATQTFGGALKATGIGLIVSLLGGLVAAFSENEGAMKKVQPIIDGLKKAFQGVFRAVEPLFDTFIDLATDALPYVSKGISMVYSAMMGYFTFIKESGGGVMKILKGIFTLDADAITAGIDQVGGSFKKTQNAYTDSMKRFSEGSKELTKTEKEELEKREENRKAALAKKEENERKAKEKAEQLEKDRVAKILEQRKKDLEPVENELTPAARISEASLKVITANQIAETLVAQDNSKRRIEIAKLETDAKIEQAQRAAALLTNISDLMGRDTAAGKAAAVAATIINTYAAAQAAFLNAQKNPISILGPAYPYISAGLAIAGGLKNVQAILSVPTPSGGGGGSAPSGSAGMGSGPSAPQFNVVGSSSTSQLAQTIGTQQNTPVQAYVVSNDVTTAQALNRNIIRGASL
jgi:hypothetical protein